MSKVSSILARKGSRTFSIPIGTTVYRALELMAENNIGSLVILDGGKYVGIMTERDYSRKVILKGKHSSDTTVDEIMSTDLPSITPNETVEQCMAIMSDKNIRQANDRFMVLHRNSAACSMPMQPAKEIQL